VYIQNVTSGLLGLFQAANPAPDTVNRRSAPPTEKTLLTSFEFWLSLEVLIFGGLVILVEFILLRSRGAKAEEILRVYAVTLIVIGTLFAITAGFDNNQIAPAMGLFGTIAGYLLGRRLPENTRTATKEQKDG
jgi:hypothetical protein